MSTLKLLIVTILSFVSSLVLYTRPPPSLAEFDVESTWKLKSHRALAVEDYGTLVQNSPRLSMLEIRGSEGFECLDFATKSIFVNHDLQATNVPKAIVLDKL